MYGGTVGIWSTRNPDHPARRTSCCSGALAATTTMPRSSPSATRLISLYGGSLQLGGRRRRRRLQQPGAQSSTGSGPPASAPGPETSSSSFMAGGTIDLVGGSGTGTQGYYGSDCYAVLGDACRGGSNDARIENVFAAQTINFSSGGQLNITGGSAGTKNSASIESPDVGGDHPADPRQCRHRADRRQRRRQRTCPTEAKTTTCQMTPESTVMAVVRKPYSPITSQFMVDRPTLVAPVSAMNQASC
jgi:hypothetical protein